MDNVYQQFYKPLCLYSHFEYTERERETPRERERERERQREKESGKDQKLMVSQVMLMNGNVVSWRPQVPF